MECAYKHRVEMQPKAVMAFALTVVLIECAYKHRMHAAKKVKKARVSWKGRWGKGGSVSLAEWNGVNGEAWMK